MPSTWSHTTHACTFTCWYILDHTKFIINAKMKMKHAKLMKAWEKSQAFGSNFDSKINCQIYSFHDCTWTDLCACKISRQRTPENMIGRHLSQIWVNVHIVSMHHNCTFDSIFSTISDHFVKYLTRPFSVETDLVKITAFLIQCTIHSCKDRVELATANISWYVHSTAKFIVHKEPLYIGSTTTI